MVTTGTEDRTRILNQIGSVHQGGRKEEGVWFRIKSLSQETGTPCNSGMFTVSFCERFCFS